MYASRLQHHHSLFALQSVRFEVAGCQLLIAIDPVAAAIPVLCVQVTCVGFLPRKCHSAASPRFGNDMIHVARMVT